MQSPLTAAEADTAVDKLIAMAKARGLKQVMVIVSPEVMEAMRRHRDLQQAEGI